MRYEKDERLLRLAIYLQSDSLGRSIDDIMAEFAVSRRTAERMRDAIERVFPQLHQVESDYRLKRWKIPARTTNTMLSLSTDELAALGTAVRVMRDQNLPEQAMQLEDLSNKLKSIQAPERLRRLEPDYEALMEAEGLAMRPGPRPTYSPEILGTIRDAILAQSKIKLHVRYRMSGRYGYQVVCPYGFLYGNGIIWWPIRNTLRPAPFICLASRISTKSRFFLRALLGMMGSRSSAMQKILRRFSGRAL